MRYKIYISQKDIKIIDRLQKGTALQRRACEIFQILLLNHNFKDFIYKIRKDMKIPVEGLSLDDENEREVARKRFFIDDYTIYRKESVRTLGIFFDDSKIALEVDKFIKEENILNSISISVDNDFLDGLVFSIIKEYSIFNDLIQIKDGVGMILRTNYEEDVGIPNELTITVSPTVTMEEFIDYIKANWDGIKVLQESILGEEKTKKRLKLSKHFIRDIQIYNKYLDLLEKKKKDEVDFKYIDLEIVKDFKDLSEGTIRSIVSKINKLVKSINENKNQNNVEDKGEVLF